MKDQAIRSTTNSNAVQNDSKLETLTSRTWKKANRTSTQDLGARQLEWWTWRTGETVEQWKKTGLVRTLNGEMRTT